MWGQHVLKHKAFLPSTMIIDHVKLTYLAIYFPKKTCGYDLFIYMKTIEIKPLYVGKYTSHMDDIRVCLSGGLHGQKLADGPKELILLTSICFKWVGSTTNLD